MCVACTHDSHLQSILIPRSPDPTTAATGHRGTRASSRRSCRCPLAPDAPLSRVPRAALASIGGQPTPCLRRLLQMETWVHAASQPTPVRAHRRRRRRSHPPYPRSYRRFCVRLVLDAAAASSSARCFWASGHYLYWRKQSTTVLAALSAVRPLAVATCHVLRLRLDVEFVFVWGGVFVCIYMCVCLGYVLCENTTSGTH